MSTRIKVGDYVDFKEDYERSGKVVSKRGEWVTISVDEGYGEELYTKHISDCDKY
jgi:hypothetical protein